MLEVDKQNTCHFLSFFFFLFRRSPQLAVELDHSCGVGEPLHTRHTGNDAITVVFMVRHVRGSYEVAPLLLCLEVATPESKSIHSTLSSTCNRVHLIDPKKVIFEPNFSGIIFGTASSWKWSPMFGRNRRPNLASGYRFPHSVGGTNMQLSRKHQHSSTNRICPVVLRPRPPRERLTHHYEPIESDR